MSRNLGMAALVAWMAAACGANDDAAKKAAPAPLVLAPERDPELAEVRAALEAGRGDLALALLERVSGLEATCLRARAELLTGDAVAALKSIARARADAPTRAEPWATEAELLANLGRLPGAAEVLAKGFERLGARAPLLRAQGVLALQTPGRAAQALEALERARALDPELAFLSWPLAQAHVLVGRADLERAPAESTAHARAARALRPELVDALELEAEALAGELRFEEALALHAELAALGRSSDETRALLEQRCATRCLLEHDRAGATEHYLVARRFGLDDEELGFGRTVLAEESRAALGRGLDAAEGGDWAAAERAFERALELAPGDLAAENHLAVARFQGEQFRSAAEGWERVLAQSLASGVVLPDPVPLNLAKAWRLAGERERSTRVLAELLDREPDGPLSAPARELLLVLEAEELAGR